jgi:crotonobetainyl-CoA:carnitine CoA-transferase CaiB-like acyl-CoA transferase
MKKQLVILAGAVLLGSLNSSLFASPGAPVVKLDALKTINDPYFRKAGEKVFLNFLNLDGKQVVVKVVDAEGRLLFFERISDSPVVEKAFNFEKAEPGTYKVEVMVTEGDSTYSESIKVNK